MVRRLFFTILALFLAVVAFCGADPAPSINLFGVLFLFVAFIVWFFWEEIQAGYSYLEDSGVSRYEPTGVMLIRFAPMHIRELAGKKRHRS